ncbi:AN1-type zinc finger protein 2A, partial [Heterocephalus glaber]
MEFPDLGKHCSEKTCKQLDFLPLKCDACEQDFCKDHFTYAGHKCPSAFKKDVQVPVCPLCNVPIPIKRGAIPDVVVGEHMDRDCTNHPGKKKKVRTCSRSSHTGARRRDARRRRCCSWLVYSVMATFAFSTDTLWTMAAGLRAALPAEQGEDGSWLRPSWQAGPCTRTGLNLGLGWGATLSIVCTKLLILSI